MEKNAYEEASSGSDDDSSSSEDEGSMNFTRKGNDVVKDSAEDERPSSDDDTSSDSSDSDSDSDSSDSNEEEEGRIKDEDATHHLDDDDNDASSGASSSSDAEEENMSDQDLPLYERLRKKEEQGVNMRSARQRKSEALQLASQRLASYNEEKKQAASGKDDGKSDSKASLIKKKKKSKHRPTEVSSKRVDFYRRGAPKLNESGVGVEIGAKRYKPQDPRVSSLSGHFNEEQFQTNYSFLEEMRNQEIGQVRKRITAYKATGEKGRRMRRKLGLDGTLEEEETRLKSLTQQRADSERRNIERVAQQTVKRKIRDE
ncbi:MAG: hypothetical protein SGILL_008827, partial [Bacillariaceae sp.]